MNASARDRKVLTMTDPQGQQYHVVTAPHGVPLREWSMAIDLYSFVLELVLALVPERQYKSQAFKLGVFVVNPTGYERCVHKATRIDGEAQLQVAAAKVQAEIEGGTFSPR